MGGCTCCNDYPFRYVANVPGRLFGCRNSVLLPPPARSRVLSLGLTSVARFERCHSAAEMHDARRPALVSLSSLAAALDDDQNKELLHFAHEDRRTVREGKQTRRERALVREEDAIDTNVEGGGLPLRAVGIHLLGSEPGLPAGLCGRKKGVSMR